MADSASALRNSMLFDSMLGPSALLKGEPGAAQVLPAALTFLASKTTFCRNRLVTIRFDLARGLALMAQRLKFLPRDCPEAFFALI